MGVIFCMSATWVSCMMLSARADTADFAIVALTTRTGKYHCLHVADDSPISIKTSDNNHELQLSVSNLDSVSSMCEAVGSCCWSMSDEMINSILPFTKTNFTAFHY